MSLSTVPVFVPDNDDEDPSGVEEEDDSGIEANETDREEKQSDKDVSVVTEHDAIPILPVSPDPSPTKPTDVDEMADLLYTTTLEALPERPKMKNNTKVTAKEEDKAVEQSRKAGRTFEVIITRHGWGSSEEVNALASARRHLCLAYGASSRWRKGRDARQNAVYTVRFAELWRAVYLLKWGPLDGAIAYLASGARGNRTMELEGAPGLIVAHLPPEPDPPRLWGPDDEADLEEIVPEERERCQESSYFLSYGRVSIHRTMLQDQVRTEAYKRAILENEHLFRGKVVLDVGCGTGILSLFAAKAGAVRVFAVDNSSLTVQTERIVKVNGFGDVVTVIRGKVEEVELPVQEVDVIVSEWMGYCLIYENMLESVVRARDRWLNKTTGLMFPDSAELHLYGLSDPELHSSRLSWLDSPCWEADVATARDLVVVEATVEAVKSERIATRRCPLLYLDLSSCSVEDCSRLDLSEIRLRVNRPTSSLHALCVTFEVGFEHGRERIAINTSPFAEMTHWRQTVLMLKTPLSVYEGCLVHGFLQIRPLRRLPRGLDIRIIVGTENEEEEPPTLRYTLR